MEITLCMIVKDEEPVLRDTVASFAQDHDQLVIVDTGSTDGTVAVAESLGAAVYHFEWCNDFSAARNYAQSVCETDWLIAPDADEELAEECRGMIRRAIDSADASVSQIAPLLIVDEAGGTFQHMTQKIYRRDRCHWERPSHNLLVVDEGVTAQAPAIRLYHRRSRRGKDRQETRNEQRNSMNLDNFRKALEENPDDPRSRFYLGMTLGDAGQPEEALTVLEDFLKRHRGSSSEWCYEARIQAAVNCFRLKRLQDGIDHLVLAHESEPRRAEAAMDLGNRYLASRAYRRAEFWFQVAANRPTQPSEHGCYLFVKPHCYGPYPWIGLAKVYRAMGDSARETAALSAATRLAGEDKTVLADVQKARQELAAGLNTPEYWDGIYSRGIDVGDRHRALLDHVAEIANAADGEKLLDIGTGMGDLLDRIEGKQAIGIDFSAAAAARRDDVVQDDAGSLTTQANQSFQVVTCCEVLEHVARPGSVLRAIKRVLVERGLLIVTVPAPGAMDCSEHVREYTEESLRSALSAEGFTDIYIERFDAWTVARAAAPELYGASYFGRSSRFPHGYTWCALFPEFRRRAKELKALCPTSKTVLDLGCAMGYGIKAMVDAGLDASGVDGSAHTTSRSIIPDRTVTADFVEHLKTLDESSVDVLTAYDLLEHVPEARIDEATREMCRVARNAIVAYIPVDDVWDPGHVTLHDERWWLPRFPGGYAKKMSMRTKNTKRFRLHWVKRPVVDLYTGPAHEEWDGRTMAKRGLRGSHKFIVYLAKGLLKRGYDVRVYNHVDEPRKVDGVPYLPYDSFDQDEHRDVLVASRRPEILSRPLNSTVKMYHHEDMGEGNVPYERYPHVWASEWQRSIYPKADGVVIPNGVDVDLFCPNGRVREKALLFAAQPQRGLDVLLDIWPRIHESLGTDWKLWVAGDFGTWTQERPQEQEQANKVAERMRETAGVEFLGMLPEKKLADRMARAKLLVYPSTYAETFCCVVAEAQASGLPIVARDLGALSETMAADCGVLVAGDPNNEEWRDSFAEQCVSLASNDEAWSQCSQAGRAASVERFSWDAVCDQWDDLLKARLGR